MHRTIVNSILFTIFLKMVVEIYTDEFFLHFLYVAFLKNWQQYCSHTSNSVFLGCYFIVCFIYFLD